MKRFETIRRFFEVLGSIIFEHISLYAAIVASVYIIYKSQITPYDNNTLLLWIIGLLGMLALASVGEKYFKLSKIDKDVADIKKTIKKSNISIDEFICTRKELAPVEDRFSGANKITITGGSLYRLSDEYYGLFENKLKNGGQLEIIMVEPFSSAANHLCDNVVYETNDHKQYSEKINDSLSRFINLSDAYGDKVTIRLTKHVPPFSLIVLDEDTPKAKIKVELYSYAVPTRERIQFLISKDDIESYSFFIKQLVFLREESHAISSLDNSSNEEMAEETKEEPCAVQESDTQSRKELTK